MQFARTLIVRHAGLLIGLLACTLLLKMVVPFGYMPAMVDGRIAIVVCPGVAPITAAVPAHDMAMPGMHHDRPDEQGHGKPEMPCAFAGLNAATLAPIDIGLLVAAIAFVFLRAIRTPAIPARDSRLRLRPPLRAPPILT